MRKIITLLVTIGLAGTSLAQDDKDTVDVILDLIDPACLSDPIFPHKPALLCLL